jgi:hypothetical protein
MRLRSLLIVLLLASGTGIHAQELFVHTEPASTMPKGVPGIRAFGQAYNEPGDHVRALTGLRIMYGVSSRLTVMATATASNHHGKTLPANFPHFNTPQIGVWLPWRFNGVNIYAKYRFWSRDGDHSHLRLAAYATASYLQVAHDEGEPDLTDDTKGVGAGIIATYLKNHFAVSFTGGAILPFDYVGDVPDWQPSLPGVPARVKYGKALNYSLSFGYLLYPRTYNSYRQVNINLYAEFLGKSYSRGQVFFENLGGNGGTYELSGTALTAFRANTYVEAHPAVQFLFNSNLRVDLGVGFPLISRSYVRYYPLYTVGIQRYLFPKDRK